MTGTDRDGTSLIDVMRAHTRDADKSRSVPVRPCPLDRAKMNTSDRVIRDGACAVLELAARRGPAALEAAWWRFKPKQRALVRVEFIQTLRCETARKETQV